MDRTPVSPDEFAALDELDDWRYRLGAVHADFRAGDYQRAAALVSAIAATADAARHHPDVRLLYPDRVHVRLTTHATHGLTTLDVDLARAISRLAAEAGAAAELPIGPDVEIAIDTLDADRIRPFWAAALGYDEVDGCLVDPLSAAPSIWFQQMDEPRIDRNRIHIDVSVAHDVAEARVAAALAAGGRLVSDARARAFWVLADADGNELCICTWQDR